METITFTVDAASLIYASGVGAATLIIPAGVACFCWNLAGYLGAVVRVFKGGRNG